MQVGHNALGAGQVVDQGAKCVDNALASGTLLVMRSLNKHVGLSVACKGSEGKVSGQHAGLTCVVLPFEGLKPVNASLPQQA